MTIHTRLHVDDPELIVDGKCLICRADEKGDPTPVPVGRLLDLDELLEQARAEGRVQACAEFRDELRKFCDTRLDHVHESEIVDELAEEFAL